MYTATALAETQTVAEKMPESKIAEREKRGAPRFPVHKASVLRRDDHEIYTTLINVSASGVAFLSAVELEIGEEVTLKCHSTQNEEIVQIDLPITIARCIFDEKELEYEVGAKLQKVTFEYREMLKHIAETYSKLAHLS